jgi:hypothetical protein
LESPPDGGDGSTELLYLGAVMAIAFLIIAGRPFLLKLTRKWLA